MLQIQCLAMKKQFSLLLFLLIIPHIIFSQMGNVLSFDGFDDRVMVDNDNELSNLSQLTIEVWVNISEYDVIHVVYRGTSNFITETYKIGIINGQPELRLTGGSSINYILSANTTLSLNEWHHIAATYDGSEGKIYINGILDNTELFNIPIISSSGGQLYIGIDRDGTNNYNQAFQGCMDELRIWNNIKSQSEIQASMNTELTGSESNLVAYYNMEQSGNQLTDISNNQNNGILEGTGGANNTPVFSNLNIELLAPLNEYSICSGESISFDVSGANEYEWGPVNLLNNPNIPNPTSSPLTQSTEFWVIGYSGCEASSDTMFFFVEVFDSFSQELNLTACPGTSITYQGVELNIGDTQNFMFESTNGCDSVVTVSVVASDFIEITENVSICSGDSILINGNYESNEGTFSTIIPGSSQCDTLLSTVLSISDLAIIQITETPSCSNALTGAATIEISSGLAPYQLLWDDTILSLTGASYTIENLDADDYSLEVVDNLGCQSSANFSIMTFDEIEIPVDIKDVSCWGNNDGILIIDSTFNAIGYSLDSFNFVNSNIFQNLSPGDYTIYAQNENGCISNYNFFIEQPEPFILNLSPDSTIELGCPIQINTFLFGGQAPFDYSWTPEESLSCLDCTDPIASPVAPTEYALTVSDSNQCIVQEKVSINIKTDRQFYIPNAFSPNGDGINDYFCIYPGKSVDKIVTFRIFNRWGAEVFALYDFKSSQPSFCWDGYFKNKVFDSGVFTFFAEILFLDGVEVIYKGDVTLMK